MTSVLCLKMRYLSNIMGMFDVILSPNTSLSSKKRLFTDCESDHISMAYVTRLLKLLDMFIYLNEAITDNYCWLL